MQVRDGEAGGEIFFGLPAVGHSFARSAFVCSKSIICPEASAICVLMSAWRMSKQPQRADRVPVIGTHRHVGSIGAKNCIELHWAPKLQINAEETL
jgi:hypothetical protein